MSALDQVGWISTDGTLFQIDDDEVNHAADVADPCLVPVYRISDSSRGSVREQELEAALIEVLDAFDTEEPMFRLQASALNRARRVLGFDVGETGT